MSPRFDINPLIPSLLEQYASITSLAGEAGKLLQRRIMLLFGQWQCINISSAPRPAIYSYGILDTPEWMRMTVGGCMQAVGCNLVTRQ
jgi:hypothetical protein